MPLPINIHEILKGRLIEWERLEFKKGWNPEAVLHTLCAFANDFHNWGGGYIFIGIEAKQGRPVLPPAGLPKKELDKIQKEIVELGYKIRPDYHPVVAPYIIQGKHILVLWAPGGQSRPYKAPVSLGKGNREYAYYIRKASSTVKASQNDEVELLNLSANVPFDDRISHKATLEDLDLPLIQAYLKKVKSDLYEESGHIDFFRLCRQMNIVAGPDEMIQPRNVGLMFFNEHPNQFFPQTQIDVVQFPEGPGGDVIKEKTFRGPLDRMVQEALAFIKSSLIEEVIIKRPDRAEADRFQSYPFAAIEEAVVNAVYHRSYEIREPIEVRVLPNSITIVSYPGPDRSIRLADLETGRFVARRYRNRRIGEFLKELKLTEGRGTGIPKILKAMRVNGSPKPQFKADEDRTYFIARFPIHPSAKKPMAQESIKGDKAKKTKIGPEWRPESTEGRILGLLSDGPLSKSGLATRIGHKNISGALKRGIHALLIKSLVELTIPEKPNSRFQRYRITYKGRQLIKAGNFDKT
jgi:ATP-dependent DNA helicase RecG